MDSIDALSRSRFCERRLNKAEWILIPCNVARSWHWFRQETASCSVACVCGIMTVNSPKWQHPAIWYVAIGWQATEFAHWQLPAMWKVALGWYAIEFAQTSAILEFRIWFRFRPYHRRRYVILHQSAKFYPIVPFAAEKMTSCRFSRRRISTILDFRGLIMGSLKTPYTTSYRS